jgi:hypothetical protein
LVDRQFLQSKRVLPRQASHRGRLSGQCHGSRRNQLAAREVKDLNVPVDAVADIDLFAVRAEGDAFEQGADRLPVSLPPAAIAISTAWPPFA